MRKFLKLFIPPFFVNLSKNFFILKILSEAYKLGWGLVKTTSYKNKEIFNKTINSARLVRDGNHERDSVLFDTIQYDWPLLSSILLVANKKLCGWFWGALGTSYYRKKYLDSLHIPKMGNSRAIWICSNWTLWISNDTLSFYESFLSIQFDIDLIMFNGSLCYLKNPYKTVDDVKSLKPKYILFTRTPFVPDKTRFQFKLSQKLFMTLVSIWNFSEIKITNFLSDLYEVFENGMINYRQIKIQLQKEFCIN